MFGRLYLGELKKLVRPKGLIVVGIICLIFFILFAVVYNINFDAIQEEILDKIEDMEELEGVEGEVPPAEEEELTPDEIAAIVGYEKVDFFAIANPDNIDNIISEFTGKRDELVKLNKEKDTKGVFGSDIYYYNCVLSMLEYMKAENVYGEDLNIEGLTGGLIEKTAEGFTTTFFEFVIGILAIYGIVLAAGSYADEYSKGTIKLVMLRPVGRNQLTTAKLLALFTHVVGLAAIMTLIGYIYGAIAFKTVSAEVTYVVFNASSVFKSTMGAVTLYKMFFKTLGVLSLISLSFILGTVTRKKTVGIIVTIIIDSGIIASLFSLFGGDKFLFSSNTDLSMFFGFPIMNMTNGANFFISLPVYLVYMVGIFTALYLTVKKRDIA